MNRNKLENAEQEYLESGHWKCSKSPTGAHYRIILKGKERCKYCGDVRKSHPPSYAQPKRTKE